MGLEERMQEREIEGRRFRAWPLGFGVALPALIKLCNLVAPLLAEIARAPNPRDATGEILSALPAVLNEADVKYFARVFGDAASIQDGENWAPLVEKNHAKYFEGEYLAFLRWLAFCAEVNFGGFFGGVMKGGAGGELLKVVASKSTSTPGAG